MRMNYTSLLTPYYPIDRLSTDQAVKVLVALLNAFADHLVRLIFEPTFGHRTFRLTCIGKI